MSMRFARDMAGASAVEFAMVAPLVLYSVVALLDVSRYVMTSQALEAGVDRAARVAMVSSADSASVATQDSLRDVVLDHAFLGGATPSVSASWDDGDAKAVGSTVTITASQGFTSYAPYLDGVLGTTMQRSKSTLVIS
ncbi:MAG: pilus assembly protein [Hyphomonadaceae bacterium]|nr:pilus assembly protein [Hyphomonadaceae bacterium]